MEIAQIMKKMIEFSEGNMDYQILIEADYIVNACESGYSRQNIENFLEKNMRTESGRSVARAVLIS